MREKEYALYKGEELLAMGTAKEIAQELGIRPKTVHHYSTPAYKKRTNSEKARRLIVLEDDE